MLTEDEKTLVTLEDWEKARVKAGAELRIWSEKASLSESEKEYVAKLRGTLHDEVGVWLGS